MKIKHLWVSKYKNVEDIDLTFKSDLITLLVGKNGLGKSNLIEILALIFRDLDLIEKSEELESWAYDKQHFEFKITYECKKSEVTIHCLEGTFTAWEKAINSKKQFTALSLKEFIERKRGEFLPNYIIGYYSGENKRIRDIIRPYEENNWKLLKKNEGTTNGLRRMFFAENHHSQLLLFTLLLYQEQNTDINLKKRATKLFKEYTTIGKVEDIGLELKNPSWYDRRNKELSRRSVYQLVENIIGKEKLSFPFWNAKGISDKIFRFLYENSKLDPIYYEEKSSFDGRREVVEKLSFNPIDYKSAGKSVYKIFGHPINFFEALESLVIIESLDKIVLSVLAKNNSKTKLNYREFSEGEQQLITVLGLILITGKDDCLFLLDEPDTHLNPDWQRDYVKLITHFNLNDKNSHIFIATHSPLIVQAGEKADIILFHKNSKGKIVAEKNVMNIHNYRIDQVLASKYFEFKNTRPPNIDSFMLKREKLLSKPKISSKDLNELKVIENNTGLLPNGETLEDFFAMSSIRILAEKLKTNDTNKKKQKTSNSKVRSSKSSKFRARKV